MRRYNDVSMKMLKACVLLVFLVIIIIYVFAACNPVEMCKADRQMYIKQTPDTIMFSVDDKIPFADLNYPLIMKPSINSTHGNGVVKVNNETEARKYVKNFKWIPGEEIIVQTVCDGKREINAFVERSSNGEAKLYYISEFRPNENALKLNNSSTPNFVHRFLNKDYVDITDSPEVTEKTKKAILDEFNRIPDLDVTRFDIIVKDSKSLSEGKFCIVEANGRGAIYHSRADGEFVPWNHIKWACRKVKHGVVNIINGRAMNPVQFANFLVRRSYLVCKTGRIDALLSC